MYALVPPTVSQTKAVMGPGTEYSMSSRMYLGLQASTGRVTSIQDKLTIIIIIIIIIIWPQHSLLYLSSLTRDPTGATRVKTVES